MQHPHRRLFFAGVSASLVACWASSALADSSTIPLARKSQAAAAEHYAAIWHKSNAGEWLARHGLSARAYQKEFDAAIQRGLSLDVVNGH